MNTQKQIPTTIFQDTFAEEVWSSTHRHHSDADINANLKRVAYALASTEPTSALQEEWGYKYLDMLSEFKVVPGGRILSNAGAGWKGTSLINCFVAPDEVYDMDSLKGILNNLERQASTLKSEGGWGENFSYIRPRGSFIKGIGVESPGAVKYMELFDKSSDIVTSGSGKKSKNPLAKGKIRKGAMMGVLDCTHPDVVEFITAKQTPGRLSKFNLSVNCTDKFMDRVISVKALLEKGKKEEAADMDQWDLKFPVTSHPAYKDEWKGNLEAWEAKGYPVEVFETVSVTGLWDLIMKSTYNRAEPGVLFLDRANYYNPLSYAEYIKATNPCGEQTLAAAGICCLSSINLTQFLNKDRTDFDYEKLHRYIRYAVRFLDSVNTYSPVPLDEYKKSMETKRRIGIGVMGWGSSLFMMKLRFAGEEASAIRDKLMSFIARTAYEASIDLAVEKGMFSECIPELHAKAPFVQKLGLSEEYMQKLRTTGIRNSALLSIQPTGNTGIVANIVSGGLEPIFMPEYVRTVIVSSTPDHLKDVTPRWNEGQFEETSLFKFVLEGDEQILRGVDEFGVVYKIDKNRGLTKEVLCEDYGVRYLKALGEWDPTAEWAVTTTELSAEDHVSDLKGFAYWIDSAVSKTINLPNEYSYANFQGIYLDAYKTGYIKGLTTYRAGTMTTVLSAKEEATANKEEEEIILDEIKLPASLPATLKTLKAEGRKWYLTLILDETNTKPVALFVQTNNVEKSVTAGDAVDRLLNLAAIKGIPEKHILDTIHKSHQDNNPTKICRAISLCLRHGIWVKNVVAALNAVDCMAGSFVFHIRKFLATLIKDGEKVEGVVCQSCGSDLVVYQEGCYLCKSCGGSKCG